MASGFHLINQQKGFVEAKLASLVNSDLKLICRHYGLPVSGTKAVLQTRCFGILDNIVSRGDQRAFEDFQYRTRNHGDGPPQHEAHSLSPQLSSNAYAVPGSYKSASTNAMAKQPLRTGFKSSPFYELQGVVHSMRALPEQPQNRFTHRATMGLRDDLVRKMKDDPSMRLLLYCGQATTSVYPGSASDVAFPNSIEIKINGESVRHGYKGLKNRPGSTKPADITPYVRKLASYENVIEITYALTNKPFFYQVSLVRYIGADGLTERIKRGHVISKEHVLAEMNKAHADADIAATSITMSLKDPVSTMRITLPVRSTVCSHNQCFDGSMFLQLQEQAPTWQCPICSKTVAFENLAVDKYVEDILVNTSKNVEKVKVEPTGEWAVEQVEKEETRPPTGKRQSYDDDFDDDDLVEMENHGLAAQRSQSNGMVPGASAFTMATPSAFGAPFQTPPLSSREPSVTQSGPAARHREQRPSVGQTSNTAIDLTLSDDDDEPPRPAKRQATSDRNAASFSHPYHSPASLPDSRYPHGNGADTNRSSSTSSTMRNDPWTSRYQPQLPAQHSFSARPMSTLSHGNTGISTSQSGDQSAGPGGQQGLRLPRLNLQHPSSDPFMGGWRSDNRFSGSPG